MTPTTFIPSMDPTSRYFGNAVASFWIRKDCDVRTTLKYISKYELSTYTKSNRILFLPLSDKSLRLSSRPPYRSNNNIVKKNSYLCVILLSQMTQSSFQQISSFTALRITYRTSTVFKFRGASQEKILP